jgi:hypothetical protein
MKLESFTNRNAYEVFENGEEVPLIVRIQAKGLFAGFGRASDSGEHLRVCLLWEAR